MPSFDFVTLTILEKSATKMYLIRMAGMMGGRNEGRKSKSSIARFRDCTNTQTDIGIYFQYKVLYIYNISRTVHFIVVP